MTSPVTIAIPFYKGAELLGRAIDSVLAQTDPAWELLVSDDGPDESTAELVAGYRDSRIRYRRNPSNLGMAGNWNACLDAATTDLVTLLHADDELRPGYVAGMRRAAERHPNAAVIFSWVDVIDRSGRLVFSVPDYVKEWLRPSSAREVVLAGKGGVESLARGNYLFCPTACYRVSKLAGRRFDADWRFVLDIRFFTDLMFAGEELVLLPDRLYAYRRHAENATAIYTRTALRYEEEGAFYDGLAAEAGRRGWHTAAAHARHRWIHRLNVLFGALQDVAGGRVRDAVEKLRAHLLT